MVGPAYSEPSPSPVERDPASGRSSLLSVAVDAVSATASSFFNRQTQPQADPRPDDDRHSNAAHGATATAAYHDEVEQAEAEEPEDAVYVGLARVTVATNERDRVKNDVILAMAIAEVAETLYVFVDCGDKRAALDYTTELLDVTWDLATARQKLHLRIEIVSRATAPLAWDEIFALPDLGAVYGEPALARGETKWLSREGMLPVAYRSPERALADYFLRGMSYFDDRDAWLRYPRVLVQGTFDHLHNGHKRLLALAASLCSERLLVGIAAAPELLARKPQAELLEPLKTRKQNVLAFVQSINASLAVEFEDVHDQWGAAGSCRDTRCLYLVASTDIPRWAETRARRVSFGMHILLVRVVRRTELATLRSSRIRALLAQKRS